MAIKDQCSRCSKSRGSICYLTNAMPSFDQTSCQNYSKAGINLDKGSQPSSGSSSSSGTIPPPPPLPSGYNPSQGGSQSTSSTVPQKQGMFSAPFSFPGRIRRTEFGISMIIYFVWLMIVNAAGNDPNLDGGVAIALLITYIPAFWFYIAQHCKRFHDRGKSGWNFFFYFIPLYNLYVLIMQFFADGDEYENDYGPDPKGRDLYS